MLFCENAMTKNKSLLETGIVIVEEESKIITETKNTTKRNVN